MGVFSDLYLFNMIKPYTWHTISLLESCTNCWKIIWDNIKALKNWVGMFDCLNHLRSNVTLHVILACHRVVAWMWNYFQTQGNIVYKHREGRQRATTNRDGLFCCALSVTPPLNECRNCPEWAPHFKRGWVFCINHSETSPRCWLCSNDAQPQPRVEIDQ